MAEAIRPSRWAVEQFGEHAADVMRHVVAGLAQGQKTARIVQAAAESHGSADKRAYGSLWATRYRQVIEQFELADLPGYEAYRPHGASYSLAVINGRVLIPFRHATSLNEPITSAKLSTKIPQQVSRDNNVEPTPTLFGDLNTNDAVNPTVMEAAAAAEAENLTVIYVAWVANADSDEVLGAWWGTPVSLEDDGTIVWQGGRPEKLDMGLAYVDDNRRNPSVDDRGAEDGLRVTGTSEATPGFAQGEVPDLSVFARPKTEEAPTAESKPDTVEVEDGNE